MKTRSSTQLSPTDTTTAVTKAVVASIVGNTILSSFKMVAGILANSQAMISDAIHSASDIFSSVIVMIGAKIAAKESDRSHPYGHERFECVAAVILSVMLFLAGAAIGYSAIQNIISNNVTTAPGALALVAAIVSIVSKEAMYQYTAVYARKIDSPALMADAWHHRSDAFSSIGALVGIIGARMGLSILDPLAGIVICLLIIKAAYDIFKDAINKMIDSSCSEATQAQMTQCASKTDGVIGVDSIKTRIFGNKIYVEIEISADPTLSLEESHFIAEKVHDAIEQGFDKVKHVTVHVNPYHPQ